MSTTHRALPFAAALLTGCASMTTMHEAPLAHFAPRPLPVDGTALFDWKGIVHCHSHLSHDSQGTLEEIVAAARAASIDFVVMTDHQTGDSIQKGVRGIVDGVLFLVGAEIGTPQGTLLAFPLQKPLRHWQHVALLAREAHEQGALAIAGHVERWKVPPALPELDGMELVNLHAGTVAADKLGTLATGIFLPMRAMCERICRRDPAVFARWDEQLAARTAFPIVGGDDAHANVRLLGPLGGTIGDYREVFLTMTTHVLAPRLDEANVVDAIRAGRTYVSFDVFGEGAGFDFRGRSGDSVVLPGGAAVAGPGLGLEVKVPAAGHITLLRDGKVVATADGERLEHVAVDAGVYRVEVTTKDGEPWLFSGAIRVLAR